MTHKYTVGQAVDFTANHLRGAAPGPYEVCRLMPMSEADPKNPRYRIKSISERHERVVSESDLTPSEPTDTLFS